MSDEQSVQEIEKKMETMTIKKKKRDYPMYWCIEIPVETIQGIISEHIKVDLTHLKLQTKFHITMLYNREPPTEEIRMRYKEICGKNVELTITGFAIDEQGCALIVEKSFEHHEMCVNVHPHISIGNKDGVKPFYNNVLVEKAKSGNGATMNTFKEPIKIQGKFRYVW